MASGGWVAKRFDWSGNPRPAAAPYVEEAWEIARVVAEIDKQLLSPQAVASFAKLAELAAKRAVTRCVELCREYAEEAKVHEFVIDRTAAAGDWI